MVGDTLVPLLRIVPIRGHDGDTVTKTYENINYQPVEGQEERERWSGEKSPHQNPTKSHLFECHLTSVLVLERGTSGGDQVEDYIERLLRTIAVILEGFLLPLLKNVTMCIRP